MRFFLGGGLPSRMQEGHGTRRIAPDPAPSCGRQNENAQLRTVGRLILVVESLAKPNLSQPVDRILAEARGDLWVFDKAAQRV